MQRFWIKAQEKINEDKKIRFFKTHNILGGLNVILQIKIIQQDVSILLEILEML